MKSGFAFHCYDNALIGYVYDYEKMASDIKRWKSGEWKLHLRLFQMIPYDKIPGKESIKYKAFLNACEIYRKARKAFVKACKAYSKEAYNDTCNRAFAACIEAFNTHGAYIEAFDTYNRAFDAYSRAFDAYSRVFDAYSRAREAYNKAFDAYIEAFEKDIKRLHNELCPDCPFDGHTIFTRKDKDGN